MGKDQEDGVKTSAKTKAPAPPAPAERKDLSDLDDTDLNLGRINYTAYCKAVGGVAFNGDPLPAWEVMVKDPTKVKIVRAWVEGADAVIDSFMCDE
jgi:hypothetical protein